MKMKELLRALQYGTKEGQGSLFADACSNEKWQQIASSTYYADQLSEFRALGEQLLQEPIQVLPYSLYKQFDTSGERSRYQEGYFEHRRRLDVFAVLAMVDENPKYIEALEDIIWAICEEYTWCLPAHLHGNSLSVIDELNRERAKGDTIGSSPMIPARYAEHRAELDLFSAETAFYLSEITYLLKARLSKLVVHRAIKEVKERVLDSYASLSPASEWETSEMNWAAVCAGSIGAAAMYCIQDDQMLAPLLHRAMESMDSFLDGFPGDGACLEGVIYWNYGFGFYTAFAELLKERTAGQVDLMRQDHVKQIALFQQKSYLNENFVISYSDCPLTSNYMAGLTHRLKKYFDEMEIPDAQFLGDILGDSCFRWMHVIRNLVWSDPSLQGEALQDHSYYLNEAEIIVSRTTVHTSEGPKRIAFSAKGGTNNEPHNHNDLGSFIVHAGAQPLFVDPGAGVYTKQYFGDQRYDILSNSSLGHSVPIIEGKLQQAGEHFRATHCAAWLSEEQDEMVLDLSQAYDSANLLKLQRLFRFDKAKGSLVLEDEYVFKEQPTSVTERFVSFLQPTLISPGVIRLQSPAAERAELYYDDEQLSCTLHKEDFVAGDPQRSSLYAIQLSARNPQIRMRTSVKIAVNFV
ncbi:heparinase II/III domain-containing protein [Paenibacillus agricola]|uniref:Heparinase II/III-like C-terminal domain-containing protein n=1 Tax=Paenibacillus agricola TaxID=2716264 RepID=A0ABX0J7E9_9BACL|nr:heparinase II/III family protein [Paenibacillus agricola]NHN31315.1 hypothetical protein [Paenibacillus agricola]